jgi:hypothetical protein
MGATVQLHYCMNKFVGWSLGHNDNDNKCGECGMKYKKEGCCKDDHKHIKLKDDHQKSTVAHYIQLIAAPAIVAHFFSTAIKPAPLQHYIPASNAPPNFPKERLYILHSIFLI